MARSLDDRAMTLRCVAHEDRSRRYSPQHLAEPAGMGRHEGVYAVRVHPVTRTVDAVAASVDEHIPDRPTLYYPRGPGQAGNGPKRGGEGPGEALRSRRRDPDTGERARARTHDDAGEPSPFDARLGQHVVDRRYEP
jgi:hypothetical protein